MLSGKIHKCLNDYTVGWLAALPVERAAAELMLTLEHDRPDDFEQPVSDPNSYTWGEITGHNVVIASLSSGQIGTVSAVSTALSMLSSFPRIRFVLMVGIGGGIVNGDSVDVRLGDVVVGQAIYQYDLGKVTTGVPWENKSLLNKPPQLLLRALANIEAKLRRGISKVTEFMEESISQLPRKRQKDYLYPGTEHDRLFRPDYTHCGGNDCAACDDSKLIIREPREDPDPEIHVGNIASGNTVVKDAGFRDLVSSLVSANCICFEMEAAGLMNDMPCMAIRGICDYSDTHKNKRWQQYAALTAAAFTRDLLSYIVSEDITALPEAFKNVQEDIKDIKDKTISLERNKHENDLKDWLKPCDPSINYIQARKLYLPGTGSWLLRSHEYAQWKSRQKPTVWLYGIPGCGKTILSSTIIEDLKSTTSIVLYFYFDFKDSSKTTFDNMLRTLIFQLYHQNKNSQRHLESLISPEQPSIQTLEAVWQDMIKASHDVYVVLDALDECKPRQELLAWLETRQADGLSILLTSRKEHDIEASLVKWMPVQERLAIKMDVVDEDIRAMVQKSIETDSELIRWRNNAKICAIIERTLMEKAQGMFRWAVCQLDTLRKCLDRRSLFKALDCLPEGLNDTYARILKSIPKGNRSSAITLLQFLTYSNRPLELSEAVDILAVDLEKAPFFDEADRMPIPHEIARCCGSLTMIVSRETKQGSITEVQLAHLSVREYLVSQYLDDEIKPEFHKSRASSCIVQVSLAYLFEISQRRPNPFAQLPFNDLAAKHWMDYAKSAEEAGDAALDWMYKLFTLKNFYTYWSRIVNKVFGFIEGTDPLYYAAMGGMSTTVKRLLNEGVNVDGKGGRKGGDSALCIASRFGHTGVVGVLLDKGAAIESHDRAFSIASELGYIEVIKLFLDKDTIQDPLGDALYAASKCNHIEIVKLLLDQYDYINPDDLSEALYVAAEAGSIEIVKLLLDRGVMHDECASAASMFGFVDIIKIFLDRGVNIDELNRALQTATSFNRPKVVDLVLSNGADPNHSGVSRYPNVFIEAILEGHAEIVRSLGDRGASFKPERGSQNCQDDSGRTALHYAARGGSVSVFDYLLRTNHMPISEDEFGRNLLDYASMSGSTEMVKRVLGYYQDNKLSIRSSSPWSPLHWAGRNGPYSMLVCLIKAGIKVEEVRTIIPGVLWSPIDLAVCWENFRLLSADGDFLEDYPGLEMLRLPHGTYVPTSFPLAAFRANILSCPGRNLGTCSGCFSETHGVYFICKKCSYSYWCLLCRHDAPKADHEHEWDYQRTPDGPKYDPRVSFDGDDYSYIFGWAGQ